MAEIENMISDMLKDPNSIKAIGDLLAGIGGGEKSTAAKPAAELPDPLDGIDAAKIACLLKDFNAPPDERCRLLLSLKPFLCPARQKRVEQSIRILKLIKIAESMGGIDFV